MVSIQQLNIDFEKHIIAENTIFQIQVIEINQYYYAISFGFIWFVGLGFDF